MIWSGFRRGLEEQRSSQDCLFAGDSNVMQLHQMARRVVFDEPIKGTSRISLFESRGKEQFCLQRITRSDIREVPLIGMEMTTTSESTVHR